MTKRMIVMLIAVLAFVAAMGMVKVRQMRGAGGKMASFEPPPEAVTTSVARQQEWPSLVSAIGTVDAVQGVTVSADLPGIVETISFQSGTSVRAGQVLVRLETTQEHAQLAAAEAQRDLARLSLERMRGLRESGVISQADYDRAAAELKQDDAHAGEIRAAIERKTIRAPFSGLLGIRKVNLGQYLGGGDPVVSLQSLRPVYVSFSVPQQEVGRLHAGTVVQLEDLPDSGKITAFDSIVDEATRNVQVQATFANAEGRLRPGMFVHLQVALGTAQKVIALPASAVSYAPYGDSVFILEQMKGLHGRTYRGVRQQFVKLGGARGDLVAVLSGLHAGDEVATSGVFKLRNGAAVQVNNAVQPAQNPTPRPEDS